MAAYVYMFTNLYFFPTEKYLNKSIWMPYPTEDNIANPLYKRIHLLMKYLIKINAEKLTLPQLSGLLFMPFIHSNVKK